MRFITKTHDQFLEEVKLKNKYYRDGEFTIVSNYICSSCKIEVVTKYGNCLIQAGRLLKHQLPKIDSAVDKTEYFRNMCYDKFGVDGNDDLSQVEYINNTTKITVIDREFGLYITTPNSYYSGARSMIRVNTTMFEKVRRDETEVRQQLALLRTDVEILPFEYVNQSQKILVKDKYGICKLTIFSLLRGAKLSIQSAIDKRAYFEARAREVHGDLYDYKLVVYKGNHSKVKIIGPNGVFEQNPHNHLTGYGCQILGKEKLANFNRENATGWSHTNWANAAIKSKNFSRVFKVYFLECWDNETGEKFYKIGKTYRTVKNRFHAKKSLPYDYNIMYTIELEDPKRICELEQEYKNKHKEYKYLPKKEFKGMHECFSKIIYI